MPEPRDPVVEARRVLKDASRIHALHDSDPKKDEDVSWLVEALANENTALREQLAQRDNELRRRRNGDELPEGWTCLDAGDGFPNLYLYSRADIVEQAKARLAQVEKERSTVWQRAIQIAKEEAFERRLAHAVYERLVEAAANSVKDSEGEGVEDDGKV